MQARGKGRPLKPVTETWMAGAETSSPSSPGLTPLATAARIVLEQHYRATTRYKHARFAFAELCHYFPDAHLETLTKDMLQTWVARMRLNGNRPNTINAKLSTVGVLFTYFDLEGCKVPYVSKGKDPQWWLTPETEARAIAWCHENGFTDLAEYIRWTVLTGLRVQESLRVQRQHFTGLGSDRPSLTVPGTKTRAAQATIPLLPEAAAIAVRLLGDGGAVTDHLFRVRYIALQQRWFACRKALGLENTYGATLKAFRRSFARIATERGVPTDMLRQYMRHELLSTTEGYLRLVGGYRTEQLREWFR